MANTETENLWDAALCEEECPNALLQAPQYGQCSIGYAHGNDGALLGWCEPQMGCQIGNEEGSSILFSVYYCL